ncbi:rho guanine nucleotide exchange factor 2 [Tachyglossus aculeatus]|uniref:rho guanine nucleotide exchange factor 2 n=1 Tax=Tachyglossus aculeatus TaxID=9261 RepID=UPI0018F6D55E|nr:rho guanine nucleotide exchange factor 2 [Tachyglossus aculeatus]
MPALRAGGKANKGAFCSPVLPPPRAAATRPPARRGRMKRTWRQREEQGGAALGRLTALLRGLRLSQVRGPGHPGVGPLPHYPPGPTPPRGRLGPEAETPGAPRGGHQPGAGWWPLPKEPAGSQGVKGPLGGHTDSVATHSAPLPAVPHPDATRGPFPPPALRRASADGLHSGPSRGPLWISQASSRAAVAPMTSVVSEAFLEGAGGGLPSPTAPEEEPAEEEEEEEDDDDREAQDAFRRHSWGPGRDPTFGSGLELRDPQHLALLDSQEEVQTLAAPYMAQGSCPRPHPGGLLCKSISMTCINEDGSGSQGISLRSPGLGLTNGFWGGSCGRLDVGLAGWRSAGAGGLVRTVSLILKRKGQAKSREKERAKEMKDARYTNGHLFTTISVSGLTMCYACSKSITAKEALICPTCNVTIHNRCKDVLANCTKVKQKQQKAALLKNSSALQSVALRSKGCTRERPSSAIYPSDSFRQSLLGSRRGRSALSLSKSVSTTNIAGQLHDESPLGLRRILSQSTDSLNVRNRTLSVESLIDEGPEVLCNELMGEFEADEKDFESDSWSLAVDGCFLQQQKKEVMKRQDVIYELIQTELHHVRTLRIMARLFRKGLLEEVQLEPAVVQGLFPCVDELGDIHTRFLARLLERRRQALSPGSTCNFVITRLGDLLVGQFSGSNAEQMRKVYADFCSRHTKALKLYKELFARDKRFQNFIRKVTRSAVLRRHGVQECILLVTQRITKYPVLINRILQHSHGHEEEKQEVAVALGLVKELLSAVDQEVHDLEKAGRLQDLYGRVDPRTQAPVPGKGPFGRDELLRRRLLHDGSLLWRTGTGRFKDVLLLLMTDVLVFLQEKDQKYIFPSLDKPAVVSLQNLIVRDVANQEKGLFLISASPPEMYEVHAASREDRNAWIRAIQHSVRLCPSREDFPLIETENEAYLRRIKAELSQKDETLQELLQEKVRLFAAMVQVQAEEEAGGGGGGGGGPLASLPRCGLFRSESCEPPRAERLLQDAIHEVELLKDLLVGPGLELPLSQRPPESDGGGTSPGDPPDGESRVFNGSFELGRSDSDAGQKDRNGNQLRSPQEEVIRRLVSLYGLLHGLQAAVAQQDTLLEARGLVEGPERQDRLTLGRANSREGDLGRPAGGGGGGGGGGGDKQATELALLQRQHGLLQEELRRCRRQGEERAAEAGGLEARLRESEQARARLEREADQARRMLAALGPAEPPAPGSPPPAETPWIRRSLDPRRRSLPAGNALYQSFTPPQVHSPPHLDLPLSSPGPFEEQEGPDPGSPEDRMPDGSDLDTGSEEEAGGHPSPPHSPRDFARMQDIPEESESREGPES